MIEEKKDENRIGDMEKDMKKDVRTMWKEIQNMKIILLHVPGVTGGAWTLLTPAGVREGGLLAAQAWSHFDVCRYHGLDIVDIVVSIYAPDDDDNDCWVQRSGVSMLSVDIRQ